MSIESLVITPVIPEGMLRAVLRRQGVKPADVVSGLSPLTEMARKLAGDEDAVMGALFLDAAALCVREHRPKRVHIVLTVAQVREFMGAFNAVRGWLKEEAGHRGPISYSMEFARIPKIRTLRLSCVDFRLADPIVRVRPDYTAWMRLPGIEGMLAQDGTAREAVIADVMQIMSQYGTSDMRVAADPHEDCLARKVRHRNGETDDEWRESDGRVMRAEHAAANAVLQDAGLPCLNEEGTPKRAFRLQTTTGKFILQRVD